MSDRNRKWSEQQHYNWDRNKSRSQRSNDYDRNDYGEAGYYSNDYRSQRRQKNLDEGGYSGTSRNYGSEYRNQNWQSEQPGYGRLRSRNWGNQYGGQYNTGYGNSYNRQGYESGMYENEYPGNMRNYKRDDYGANAEYLQNQPEYNRYEAERDRDVNYRRDQDRDWWDRTRDEVSSWFGDEEAEQRRMADREQTSHHKGKGPKGYKRSDQRIQEDVCDRLSDDYYLDASDIEVKVQEGEVVLTGTVNDRDQKRRAEDLVERISGVRDVENHIKVKREDTNTNTYTNMR